MKHTCEIDWEQYRVAAVVRCRRCYGTVQTFLERHFLSNRHAIEDAVQEGAVGVLAIQKWRSLSIASVRSTWKKRSHGVILDEIEAGCGIQRLDDYGQEDGLDIADRRNEIAIIIHGIILTDYWRYVLKLDDNGMRLRDWIALQKYVLEGLTYAELAEEIELSPSGAQKAVSRSMRHFASYLRGCGFQSEADVLERPMSLPRSTCLAKLVC